jgi:CRISPR-associated protein Csb1
LDSFLRQGCLLVPKPDQPGGWQQVARSGERTFVELTHASARAFAADWARKYGVGESRQVRFSRDLAKADLTEKDGTKTRAKSKKAG